MNLTDKMKTLISLLPFYSLPKTLLYANEFPSNVEKIQNIPTEVILNKINRETWVETVYVDKTDLHRIIRYKDKDGNYRNDFNENQFVEWIKTIEKNTLLCNMKNKHIGKGVFVPPGKILAKGTFIPSSGIIKLDPTIEELETKIHCSALQDLNSPNKKIVGFIDPEKKGGILNFINHAPDLDELANFRFKSSSVKNNVATSNLTSTIKFYNGYAIMGLQAREDINGGEFGTQLLWSYAHSYEYIADEQPHKKLFLFCRKDMHECDTIDANCYEFIEISLFIDSGDLILHKATTLTRWELMESHPTSSLNLVAEDPFTSSKKITSKITYKHLQEFLKKNPIADRVIIKISK